MTCILEVILKLKAIAFKCFYIMTSFITLKVVYDLTEFVSRQASGVGGGGGGQAIGSGIFWRADRFTLVRDPVVVPSPLGNTEDFVTSAFPGDATGITEISGRDSSGNISVGVGLAVCLAPVRRDCGESLHCADEMAGNVVVGCMHCSCDVQSSQKQLAQVRTMLRALRKLSGRDFIHERSECGVVIGEGGFANVNSVPFVLALDFNVIPKEAEAVSS